MISRRKFVATSALATLFSAGLAPGKAAAQNSSLPWRNWSGGLLAHPKGTTGKQIR